MSKGADEMAALKRILLFLFGVLLLTSCGQKSAGLQEGTAAPDTQLFENGMKYLEKSQYTKSRLAFQTLINTYPDSDYTPSAFLAIADSYYGQQGTENYLQAEAQYKDFLIFYPTHGMADDAQMKICALNFKLIKPYDRDPTYAKKAEVECKRVLDNYPDSELAPTAREALREVQDILARHDQDIGDFYFKRSAYNAAEGRYKEVLDKYPDYGRMDETLFRLGESLEQTGRVTEASVYYEQIAREYPFSEYFEDAKNKLVLLEQQVPAVDQQAATRHKMNRTEETVSLMDPLRSVWEVFTGRPDIYEVARKRAEERRMQQHAGLPDEGMPIPQN